MRRKFSFSSFLKGIFACLGVMVLLSDKVSALTGDLLFFQQTTGDVYQINQTTGASTLIASPGSSYNWNGAAFDSSNGLVYVDNVGTTNELGSIGDGGASNTIYSFNPVTHAIALVGTVSGGQPSLFDAAFHAVSGTQTYYTIPINTTSLQSYTFTSGVTAGATTSLYGLTAPNTASGGASVAVTGLLLGDIDFIGNSLYIYGLALTAGGEYQTNMLYEYANYATAGTVGPTLAIAEGTVGGTQIGAGLSYNPVTGLLEATDTDNNLYTINPTTGAETFVAVISGSDTGGNGDYTVAVVPEPSPFYGIGLILLVSVGVSVYRRYQPKPAVI